MKDFNQAKKNYDMYLIFISIYNKNNTLELHYDSIVESLKHGKQ